MYTAFYRQWRPTTLDDVVGQRHVTVTLKNAAKQGRISHAYLFCGPRGVGKTTVARILARAVNCKEGVSSEPCGKCSCCQSILAGACLDVLEIDAASNRGIDEIRDLREKVKFYPAECRYKVYIIDEVHMLTQEAFNALLKTLEEPPPHAIFILATTESHKIPLTILSRCQRFDFHRLEPEEIMGRLSEVISGAGASADQGALLLIARAADGALRDALVVLDQAVSLGGGHVTSEVVLKILGLPEKTAVFEAARAVAEGDVQAAFRIVDELLKTGRDLRQFMKDLAAHYRDLLIVMSGGKSSLKVTEAEAEDLSRQASLYTFHALIGALKAVTQAESDMRWNSWPRLVLETCLLSLMAKPGAGVSPATSRGEAPAPAAAVQAAIPHAPSQAAPPVRATAQPEPQQKKLAASPKPSANPSTQVRPEELKQPVSPAAPAAQVTPEALKQVWREVLDGVKKERATIAALLQEGKPTSLEGDTLVLQFLHQFHKNALDSAENKAVIEKVLREKTGRSMNVRLELSTERAKKSSIKDDPLVRGALELFGGEIIPESDETEIE